MRALETVAGTYVQSARTCTLLWIKTKFAVMGSCRPLNIPVDPVLSLKDIAEDPSLRETRTVVEVDYSDRDQYLTFGCPIKLFVSPIDLVGSLLHGEHTEESLIDRLGYCSRDRIKEIESSGAI